MTMTVGELKKALEGVDDGLPCTAFDVSGKLNDCKVVSAEPIRYEETKETKINGRVVSRSGNIRSHFALKLSLS